MITKLKSQAYEHRIISVEHPCSAGLSVPLYARGWAFHIGDSNRKNALMSVFKSLKGRVLDHGCGDKKFEPVLRNHQITDWVGLDLEDRTSGEGFSNRADVVYDGVHIPLDSNSFDVVMSTQVLEHVPDLSTAFSEITRVLKPGGVLVATVPQVSPLHEEPFDFRRFTPYGISKLGYEHGMQLERSVALTGPLQTIGTLAAMFVHPIKPKFLRRMLVNAILAASILGERLSFRLGFRESRLTIDYLFILRKSV